MFIFIYNTLVLDVKRIDFEARMIDTLRSSSRPILSSFLLLLFFYLPSIDPRGFSPIFFFPASIRLFAASSIYLLCRYQ